MAAAANDGGALAGKGKEATVRTCVVTRAEGSPDDLVRFVAGPDGTVVPDVARALPGRGVWVTLDRATVEQAVARKSFAQALRRKVAVPADLAGLVDQLIERRVREALSLCNKAGLVAAGFTQVEAAILGGEVAVLVHASDAAADGADKLDRRYRAICRELDRPMQVVNVLSGAQLSLAMGRPNVIHAGLKSGGATARFLNEARRLTRYRRHEATACEVQPGADGAR